MLLGSIRSRLIGLVVASVAPFAALIGVGLWNRWHTDHMAALERAVNEARLIAGQVDDHVGNLRNLLSGLGVAVSWEPKDTEANDRLLRRVKSELPPYISNLLLFTPDGTNIGTSETERFFAGDRNYMHQVLAGQDYGISGPILARRAKVWVVAIARPIKDAEGNLRAVLVVGTWLERLQDALNTGQIPPGRAVRIVDDKLAVVAHSIDGASVIGRDLSQSATVVRHFKSGRDISETVRWSDDVERITGSAKAQQVPWMVSVGLPLDVAYAPVLRRLGAGLAFTLATLLAAFGIVWMLSRRIARPLRQLGADAAALAAGDLSHRTRVETHGEVGLLAKSFNQMAAALQQREEDAARAADDLRHAMDTLSAVIDASPVAIVCSDLDRRIFLWNKAAERIFGFTAEEAIGRHARQMPPPVGSESVGLLKRALAGEIVRDLHLKRMRKDGVAVDVRAAAAAMHDANGTVRGVARAYEDFTEQKRAEEQLTRIAHYDQLTGLPNRLTLQQELGRHLSGSAPTAIALFDLDGFKDVNDTLGHSTGDRLLVEVGHRLVDVAGDRGQVCRLGGDEFIVILPKYGNPLMVSEVVETMLKRLAEPFTIGDDILHVGGSAGVAIAPNDGKSVDELIANADLALYQAKSAGRQSYRFFLPVLRAQAQARRSLDIELRRAYCENELELYFQPQVYLADGAVVGAEALLRWRHPVAGILAPGTFIETLAASTIAPEVSRWIIRTACSKTAAWRAQGLDLGRIAINVFPTQLADEALLHDLDDVLRETGLPPDAIELEITENVALDFGDTAVLHKIHDRGIKLAFDDFGTGYASLSYLRRFPLSRIKIDRSFVGKVTEDAGDAAIVRSLIAMAHNLGLEVIAEGVETTAQAAFLLNETCEEAQGYLYSKPLPANEFEFYLRNHPPVGADQRADRHLGGEAKFQHRSRDPLGRRAPGG
jgi:diguanylate cyclase (GGDEF)-like protein/PAS domain S-box-containing protein